MQDHLEAYASAITSACTPLTRQAAVWCCLHKVPLNQSQGRDWLIVKYEDLASDPFGTTQLIFDHLGFPFGPQVERHLRATTSLDDGDPFGIHRISRKVVGQWRAEMDPAEVNAIMRLTREFAIGLYD